MHRSTLDRRQVDLAESLNARAIGTLPFDLVETTDSSETERHVGLLAQRLLGTTRVGLDPRI